MVRSGIRSARHRVRRSADDPPARPGRLQVGAARGHRLGAVPGIPAVGPAGRRGRSAYRARAVRDQGQGALRSQAHAAPAPGGPHNTVISGVFYIGLGDEFDGENVKAYPPGSVNVLPGDTPHFHWAKSGEYVTQISAIGPLGLEYARITDDPRHANASR